LPSVTARIGVRLVVDVSPDLPFLGEALVSFAALAVRPIGGTQFWIMIDHNAGDVHDLPRGLREA
jgi:hypothetical protein